MNFFLRTFIFVFFLSTASSWSGDCFAQNKNIDSLQMLLNAAQPDTNRVNLLQYISQSYLIKSNFDSALKYANDELLLASKITVLNKTGWQKGIAWAYYNIGQVYYLRGEYPTALKNYLFSVKTFNSIGEKKDAAVLYRRIGTVYYAEGNYSESLENHLLSLRLSQDINYKTGIADAYSNIGIIYYFQKDFDKALENNFISLEIKKEIGEKEAIARSYGSIGTIYNSKAMYSDALKNLFEALKIYTELKNEMFMSYSYNNIGVTYQSMGDDLEALKYHQMSLAIKEKLEDKLGVAGSFINLGDVYIKLNQLGIAKGYLTKALDLSKKIGSKDRIKDCYKSLTTLDSLNGSWKDAYFHHILFVDYQDSLKNEESDKKIIQLSMKQEFSEIQAKEKTDQEKKDLIAFQEKKKAGQILILVLCVLLLAFIFSGYIFYSLRTTRKQKLIIEVKNHETEEQKKIIEEKNKDITDSIYYAKRIQNALLREEEHVSKHLPEHFILFLPKDIVSGDFYWGFEKYDYWYLAAADCTGHGVPGAIMSMLGISFLNDIVAADKLYSPAEILDQLRDKIISELRQTGEEGSSKDGMDISLIRLNLKTFELQWAGANNALNYIQAGELKEIKADKQPIGYHTQQKPFTNHEIKLQKGDSIYLYSDGYADQFGGPKGKKLTYKKLDDFIIANYQLPLTQQKELFKQYFNDWKGPLEQLDDVCVIGVKI